MRNVDVRRYVMLVRARDFGLAHLDLFGDRGVGRDTLADLARSVGELTRYRLSESEMIRAGTQGRVHARAMLVKQLRGIDAVARLIATRAPGFDVPFRMTHRRLRDQMLVFKAGRVLELVEANRSRFLEFHMRATFVDELRAALERFDEAMTARRRADSARAAANAGAAAAFVSAYRVLHVLDVLVENVFTLDAQKRALWEATRRPRHPKRVRRARISGDFLKAEASTTCPDAGPS